MEAHRNILALDVGERRIGVAFGNVDDLLAKPLTTIYNTENTFSDIQKLIKEHSIDCIVVGLPRNLNGDDTAQTTYARSFGANLASETGLEIFFEDEALSSVRAKEVLDQRSKPYKKEDIDALAAAFILDDYLKKPVESNS